LGIVAVVILVLVSGGAAGAAGIGDSSTTPVSIATAQEDDEDDTRHEHPDDADGDGDDDELARWLADQLSESLGDSTVELSEGEYDSAREVLGDDYDDRLEQFVEVDGDTDADTEDEEDEEDDVSDAFEEATEEQEKFINATEEYNETLEEYEQALEDGDEQRARELARELDAIENRVSESGGNLDRAYRIITEGTRSDLSEERETVTEISEDISQTQDEIREFVFVATELTIDTDLETGSFADPLLIEGELTAADDAALDDERIVIEVDGRTTETTTDNGTFALEYRPVELDADADTVTVEFVPDPSSEYLADSAEAQVDVTPVEPTIEIKSATESAAYADKVTLSGTAHVDGTPVDQLPVRAQFDEQFQGETVRTGDDGAFTTTVTAPADVPDGETDVSAVYDRSDRALSRASASTTIEITSTPTRIEADAEAADTTVSVTGILTTDDGEPVSGQTVHLTHDGSPIGTVETNAAGEFEETVEFMPKTIPEDGIVGITAVFDGTGTNLEDSEAGVAAALTLPDTGGDSGLLPVSLWSVAGLLGVVALVLIGALTLGRVDGLPVPDISGSDSNGGAATAPERDHSSGEHDHDTNDPEPIDETPTRLLEAGRPNEAVIVAYEHTRNRLGQGLDTDQPRTYWEFYRDWQDGIGGDSELLRALTEQYEQATFTTQQIETDDANEAIDRAAELTETESA
jgi:hypothetical protein